MQAQETAGTNPIVTLLNMAQMARHAENSVELDFMAVNSTHALAPYRQAALWFSDRGVSALSGVVQVEANAPYAEWLGLAFAALQREDRKARPVVAADLPSDI